MPTSGLLFILLNLLAVAVAVRLLLLRRFNLLDPSWAILIGYSINYCLRPALIYLGHGWGIVYAGYYRYSILANGFDGSIMAALLFLVAFIAGNIPAYRFRRACGHLLPDVAMGGALHSRRYHGFSLLFLLTGWISMYFRLRVIRFSGSWLDLLLGRSRGAQLANGYGLGIYMVTTQLALIGWMIYCVRWAYLKWQNKLTLKDKLEFIVYGFFCTLLFMIQGSRMELATLVFIPLASYFAIGVLHAKNREIKPFRWGRTIRITLLIALIAGPLGMILKHARSQSLENTVNLSLSAWDAFEGTAVGLHYIHSANYLWGRTYWQDAVYTFLPRAMFPWKPKRYGIMLAQDLVWPALRHMAGTFPPGAVMEAYVNGGYAGIFLIGFLCGLFCHLVYEKLMAASWFWICLALFLFPVITSFRGLGSIIDSVFVFPGSILMLTAFLCRIKLQQTSENFNSHIQLSSSS